MAIGKTRQPAKKPRLEERFDPGLEEGRGLLRWPPQVGIGKHVRRLPAADLAPFIECFWMVTWDLDQPYVQETLPHPSFYFAFQDGRATIGGVNTGKSSHALEGRSGVFGIKFRPGGFRPLMTSAAISLANRIVPAGDIFLGRDVADLEASLNSASWDEDRMIAETTAFLRQRLPEPDPEVEQADSLVRQIREDRGIKTVNDLSIGTVLGMRTLQRIFREYVGANPKWVIRRFRLHELVEMMNSGGHADWSQMALELGYFDQAHLINDFKSIVGYTPAQYRK
jgi:AraC-like DNA-binding protein